MRSYVIVAGVIFALVTLAHVWRVVVEPNLVRDPWFIAFTGVSAGLTVAAWRVVCHARPSS